MLLETDFFNQSPAVGGFESQLKKATSTMQHAKPNMLNLPEAAQPQDDGEALGPATRRSEE